MGSEFHHHFHYFFMVSGPPAVQESTENQTEIAPGKHMPKKCENLGAEPQKHENDDDFSGAAGGRDSLFCDPGAFRVHFLIILAPK